MVLSSTRDPDDLGVTHKKVKQTEFGIDWLTFFKNKKSSKSRKNVVEDL